MLSHLEVDNEDEGVVVLDFLHGGFSGERIANDGISVHAIAVRHALPNNEKKKRKRKRRRRRGRRRGNHINYNNSFNYISIYKF